jgi:hypothetical protein
VREWCNRHAGWLATGFCLLTVVLGVLAVAQAIELHAQGWRIAMGTIPEWMAGFGTIFTAIAAVAAYLAFRVTAAERRDHEMSQARLIIIEPVKIQYFDLPAWRKYGELEVHNHSTAPVFDLLLEFVSPKDAHTTIEELTTDDNGNPTYRLAQNRPVLLPHQSTPPFFVTQSGNQLNPDRWKYVAFRFTDARGLRWRRTGGEQPVQLFDDVVPLTPVTVEPIHIEPPPKGF